MKKQAKFFCENCGEEVAQNARFCKKCGRFFSAVRCPQCGKVGSSHAFVNGCPSCGYAEKGKAGKKKSSSDTEKSYEINQNKGHFFMHKPQYSYSQSGRRKNTGSNSLPLWIYGITLGALAVTIFIFVRCSL